MISEHSTPATGKAYFIALNCVYQHDKKKKVTLRRVLLFVSIYHSSVEDNYSIFWSKSKKVLLYFVKFIIILCLLICVYVHFITPASFFWFLFWASTKTLKRFISWQKEVMMDFLFKWFSDQKSLRKLLRCDDLLLFSVSVFIVKRFFESFEDVLWAEHFNWLVEQITEWK